MRSARVLAPALAVFLMGALTWANLQPQAYGAVRSKVYHTIATCSTGKRIKTKVTFATTQDAERQGRRLCAECGRKK